MDTLAILGLSTIGSIVIILIGMILVLCIPYGPAYDGVRSTITISGFYLFSTPSLIIDLIFTALKL